MHPFFLALKRYTLLLFSVVIMSMGFITYSIYTAIKRHALRYLLSLSILLFFLLHALKLIEWDFIQAIEHKLYDVRLELTISDQPDDRIVIVDIDEKSLSEIGRWPWNRSIIAKLVDQLFDSYEIDVLGMDVVFVEPDESSGLKQLELIGQGPLKESAEFQRTLNEFKTVLDYDGLLAKSLQNRRVILGYTFTTIAEDPQDIEAGQLPPPTFTESEVSNYGFSYRAGQGFAANLPNFQKNAMSAGHFNVVPDSDGIVRRMPMLFGYRGQLYQSLSLAITRAALGAQAVELNWHTEGKRLQLAGLQIGNRQIPVTDYFETFIPYRGHWGSFPYVSATDVLHGSVEDPSLLENKIVLLGTTAQGLLDLRATPIQSVYPGVEIHASLISGILDGRLRHTLPYESILESLILVVIGIIMTVLLALFSPLITTLTTLGLAGLIISINLLIWNDQFIVFPLASTLLLIFSLFVFNMSYGYFVESTNKRHLTNLFGQYIPPELVDEMSKNLGNKPFSMESESRDMTVLFSDVRGFTTISEELDPKQLSELMNEYLTPMTRIIHEHRGTIDKYMGDAIMAFWGAPLHDPHHARHALDAAMEMLNKLEDLHLQFLAKGWPELQIGIGLNTGMMNVGNMGSQFRVAYTVLGDAVNLGSRLEGLTKKYGVRLIVCETTQSAVPEYVYRELDRVRVKGKDLPVAIFEPLGLPEHIPEQVLTEITYYQNALEHYRQQHWEHAEVQFVHLHRQYPERLLYKIYLQRIDYFSEYPPGKDWDGVYTFTTK
jgi:adenylate cyclase